MQIYERTLSKFEKIFLSKKKLWSLFFFNSLSFCQKCGKLIAKMHMNLSKQLEFQNKAIENETFKKILSFSQQMRLNLSFFSIVLKFFYERKSVFSRILFARLKLKTFLLKQITIFAEKIDYFIALSRQRALYKQTLKVLIENSRFKDYIPIKKRVLFLNKRMINAFIYYNPIKLEILITSEDSDIKEYNEILTHDKKIKEMTIIYINDVSNYRETLKKMLDLLTMNITLIKCDSKSLEKTFKLYSPESLSSALFLQRYILKKLYFRIFEISDKEYDYKCKVCVHLSTYNGISRIVLLLKTLPSFVKNICDFPDNCLNYLQIADKMNNLENFIERYVSFNERQKEFVFIPPSNNKWIIKKKKETLIQNQEKSFFELGAEIDYLNDKISIRLLKDENKFYKILIPESFTLSQKKKFIKEALESVLLYYFIYVYIPNLKIILKNI